MERLVMRARLGDEKSFAELIRINKDTLYRVARTYLKSDADISDAVQETILKVWQSLADLKKPQYFKTWMIKILINECLKTYNQNSKIIPVEDISTYQESANDMDIEITVTENGFLRLLEMLTERTRTVVALYYGEEMSVKEIAEILDLSQATVKKRLQRGRDEIRRCISNE